MFSICFCCSYSHLFVLAMLKPYIMADSSAEEFKQKIYKEMLVDRIVTLNKILD